MPRCSPSAAVTLVGGLGNDTLVGTNFDDVLDGGITDDYTGLDTSNVVQ